MMDPELSPKRPLQIDVLRAMPLFAHLDAQALLRLYRSMTPGRFYGGAIVVDQFEPDAALYIVVKGELRNVLFNDNGREVTLARLGPGDIFGLGGLVDGEPRTSTVVATTDVLLLTLSREAFLRHLAEAPRTAVKLLAVQSSRLRRATELIHNLALLDVPARLSRVLLSLAEKGGEPFEKGVLIRRRPTQQELANMVGTCRETVSRTLSAMARQGLLVTRGRSIYLSRELLDSMQDAA